MYIVAAEKGSLELVLVAPLVLPFVLTIGHSRAMRCSSFMASPALFEVALVVSDGRVSGCSEAPDEACGGLTWSLVTEWPRASQKERLENQVAK